MKLFWNMQCTCNPCTKMYTAAAVLFSDEETEALMHNDGENMVEGLRRLASESPEEADAFMSFFEEHKVHADPVVGFVTKMDDYETWMKAKS